MTTRQTDLEPAIASVARDVRDLLTGEGSGHDWEHIARVWHTAKSFARQEKADPVVVSLAALLHDVDDRKLTGDVTTETALPSARRIMAKAGIGDDLIETVCGTICQTGFHKSLKSEVARTVEAHILSDADQLDAIGAIGIARTFVYGASRQRPLFEPDSYPMTEFTAAQYDANRGSTVNHFFEKLLKLRGMMFTDAGRQEAERRHRRMVSFLAALFEETGAPSAWAELLDEYRQPLA